MVSVAEDKPQRAFPGNAIIAYRGGWRKKKKRKSFSFVYVDTQCRFTEGPKVRQ